MKRRTHPSEVGVTILHPSSCLHIESGICSSCFILLFSPLSRSKNTRCGRKVVTSPRHPARIWLEGMSGRPVRGSEGSEMVSWRGRLPAGRSARKVRWARGARKHDTLAGRSEQEHGGACCSECRCLLLNGHHSAASAGEAPAASHRLRWQSSFEPSILEKSLPVSHPRELSVSNSW